LGQSDLVVTADKRKRERLSGVELGDFGEGFGLGAGGGRGPARVTRSLLLKSEDACIRRDRADGL